MIGSSVAHRRRTMLSQIVAQLSRLMPQAAAARGPSTRPIDDDDEHAAAHGWHESSFLLSRGADVIELPPAAAASLFADTQPAFHWPGEEPTLAA